jgi:hypothetical protein
LPFLEVAWSAIGNEILLIRSCDVFGKAAFAQITGIDHTRVGHAAGLSPRRRSIANKDTRARGRLHVTSGVYEARSIVSSRQSLVI